MFGKKKQPNLMVKDLLNDLERAECIKSRIREQLAKDVDRPIQFGGMQGVTGMQATIGSSVFSCFPESTFGNRSNY